MGHYSSYIQLWFSNPYFFAIQCRRPWIFKTINLFCYSFLTLHFRSYFPSLYFTSFPTFLLSFLLSFFVLYIFSYFPSLYFTSFSYFTSLYFTYFPTFIFPKFPILSFSHFPVFIFPFLYLPPPPPNNLTLKYQRFTWSGCQYIGIRNFEFVAKT